MANASSQQGISKLLGSRTAVQTLWALDRTENREVDCPECDGFFLIEMGISGDGECAEGECPDCKHFIILNN